MVRFHRETKTVFFHTSITDYRETRRTQHALFTPCTSQTLRGPIQSPRRLQSPLRSSRVAFHQLLLLEGDLLTDAARVELLRCPRNA